jgi:hypothetical protein
MDTDLATILGTLKANVGAEIHVEIGAFAPGDAPDRQYARIMGTLGPWRMVDDHSDNERGVVFVPLGEQHEGGTGLWIEGDRAQRCVEHSDALKVWLDDGHYIAMILHSRERA